MSLFDPIQTRSLTDSELKEWVIKYRSYSFLLLGFGAILLLFLIWFDSDSEILVLLFLADFLVLMPVILKSNTLHKEFRNRKAGSRNKKRNQQQGPVNITIKFD